ncbi:phosphate ABC transporter substrate-binding protein [Glaciecola sp. MH2013]|uniref:phosphate ABC transporter substrate-binding protein n=1 Tax=Glaciecola sp. MH2013 TaxID=2785524 RepID=UPI00189EB4E2|nr:phosphate ABC transporter substrate-binding protein [Glaciecola sp. MH2013]MBF7073037.1 phosphate ABC transporter substrate-binding protein [Glaciecola sp. MH2013]
MFKKFLLAATLLFAANMALAEIVVVVNPANANALDSKTVQRIFLGKDKKFADGAETIAVNQVADNQIRQDFDQNVLGRSSSQVSAYWSKLVFTGKGIPPKEVASDAEVIDLVSKNPSVIGYINKASVTDAVKVVEL